LEIYGPRGEALHEVAEGAVKRPNGTIAAKPKRVTEYLILEKRLWYDTPWIFREQMWETKN
jgi:protein MBA1